MPAGEFGTLAHQKSGRSRDANAKYMAQQRAAEGAGEPTRVRGRGGMANRLQNAVAGGAVRG